MCRPNLPRQGHRVFVTLLSHYLLFQKVRNWFANEAKAQTRAEIKPQDPAEPTPGKSANFNKRTVCGKLFAAEVQAAMKDVRPEGVPSAAERLKEYQEALTEVWNGLSEGNREKCERLAEEWNTGESPVEDQRK